MRSVDRQRCLRALIGLTLVVIGGGGALTGCRRRPPADRDGADSGLAHGDLADAAGLLRLQASPVFIANHGKLVGAFNGFAWVAGSDFVRIDTPNPCNEQACFRGVGGVLCSRGVVSAPACPAATSAGPCLHDAWALKIGWDAHREGGPWGPSARPYVSLDYRGAKHARLAAHRSGDPTTTEFCIDDYVSGELVAAGRFRVECWKGRGEPLASFEAVDKFILELPASGEPAPFDVCVTAIHVAEPVDAATDAASHSVEAATPDGSSPGSR